MKETTVINKINNLADSINYKKLYIEIETNENRYIIEKENNRKIGFDINAIK